MHFQKSGFHHFLHAVSAEDVNRFGCPDALPAFGTNVLACTRPFARRFPAVLASALSGLVSSAGRRSPDAAAPVDADFCPALVDDVFQQGFPRLCDGPAVFVVMPDNQPPPFCFVPEFPVVVQPAPTAILDIVGNVVQVYHFVHQSSYL